MILKRLFLLLLPVIFWGAHLLHAQNSNNFEIKSPDGSIALLVQVGEKLTWAVQHKDQQIIVPSSVSLKMDDGSILGLNARVKSSNTVEVNTEFKAINYR
ncbi:glycoside hydrolase family 97 N-terminal domain-containing protein, partial [Bacteroidota bacterium]